MNPSPWQLFKQRGVQLRALKTSLVVGTLLALINYGDLLLVGNMASKHWLKLALSYLVPYGVASWSSVQALLSKQPSN